MYNETLLLWGVYLSESKNLEKDIFDITVNQREYASRLDKLECKVEEMNKSVAYIKEFIDWMK